jgi:hypothetical protein
MGNRKPPRMFPPCAFVASETKASVTNKLARSTFPATFQLRLLAALELEEIRLEVL